MVVVTPKIKIPLSELRFTFTRSSGPGGQNVNKVSSKATLRWAVVCSPSLPDAVRQRFVARYRRRLTKDGEIIIASQRFRDRGRNVDDCLERLQAMVASVVATPKKRRPTGPTRGSQIRRRKDKQALSGKKQLRRGPASED